MNKYVAAVVCCAIIISTLPGIAHAQTSERKAPRKYDKLLTAVESFAKLNAQIEIREKEFNILIPFVFDVINYSDQLKAVCDPKCIKSVNTYRPKLQKFSDALNEAHRRYQAMTPAITERNTALMSEIKRVASLPLQLSKEKAMAALNQVNLENVYHYKAYSSTYHSADKAMLSLAASSDLTLLVNSFATTTSRLVASGSARASMNGIMSDLKNKVPDIRARIKALEERRKSIVCTASLASDYSVGVRCLP